MTSIVHPPAPRARSCLLLVGVPGAGKTTLVRTALQSVPRTAQTVGLLTYLQYPGGIELGGQRAAFGGTDMLPMQAQPFALQWLTSACRFSAVLAEGDRLGNGTFVHGLLAEGWLVTLAWLDCPPDVAAARRHARGSHQNASWLRGRQTKVARLVQQHASLVWRLDATRPLAALVAMFHSHPVVQQLAYAIPQTRKECLWPVAGNPPS